MYTAGSHSVGGVAGQDDDILPPAVQRVPRPGEAGLSQSTGQSHTYADSCHKLSHH